MLKSVDNVGCLAYIKTLCFCMVLALFGYPTKSPTLMCSLVHLNSD